MQRLLEYAPSTGSLALWMHHVDDERAAAGLVDNDGNTIRYGERFAHLSLARQTGLVAHQVLHVALRHAPRFAALQRQLGQADAQLFNLCADAIVNSALDHLGWLELHDSLRLEAILANVLGASPGQASALLEWDVERLYRAIDDRRPDHETAHAAQSGAMRDGPRAGRVRMMGQDVLRDLQPAPAGDRPETEVECAREWHERLVRGHADDGDHSLLRVLLGDLPRVRTPWEQWLRTRLAHGLSLRPTVSWSRPSRSWLANRGRLGNGRRMPWEPGMVAGRRSCRLAIMVDVSGSIAPLLLERFAREIDAITRRTEATGVLIVGDDRVRHVAAFEPGRSRIGEVTVAGGGGTDFSPLLEEAQNWRPDIGVFLTDLDGPAAYRPRFPVLWAVVGDAGTVAPPFGSVVALD